MSWLDGVFGLDGKVAVVTGAGGRLGPVWIHALTEAGASVLALDQRPTDALATLVPLLQRLGPSRLIVEHADVRDRGSLERALSVCVDRLGTPHVLVNNAGIDHPPDRPTIAHALQDIPFDISREIMDVNVLGAFTAAQVFGGRMADTGGGSIINIGSIYASVSPNARLYDHIPAFLKPPAYGASKAALVNLTKQLATLWAPRGVRVNTLSPGGVRGDQDVRFVEKYCAAVPLGRMSDARDLWGPLVFLASDAASYVTGAELIVDGGFTAW